MIKLSFIIGARPCTPDPDDSTRRRHSSTQRHETGKLGLPSSDTIDYMPTGRCSALVAEEDKSRWRQRSWSRTTQRLGGPKSPSWLLSVTRQDRPTRGSTVSPIAAGIQASYTRRGRKYPGGRS